MNQRRFAPRTIAPRATRKRGYLRYGPSPLRRTWAILGPSSGALPFENRRRPQSRVRAHRGVSSAAAILVAIVLEGPVDADGLWKAVDGYEVQQEDPAHRFPRALGKPAHGRRFPTAPTRPRLQGFPRAPEEEKHTPDRLNGREQKSYRRFAPTACSRSAESLITIPDPAITITGIRTRRAACFLEPSALHGRSRSPGHHGGPEAPGCGHRDRSGRRREHSMTTEPGPSRA